MYTQIKVVVDADLEADKVSVISGRSGSVASLNNAW